MMSLRDLFRRKPAPAAPAPTVSEAGAVLATRRAIKRRNEKRAFHQKMRIAMDMPPSRNLEPLRLE